MFLFFWQKKEIGQLDLAHSLFLEKRNRFLDLLCSYVKDEFSVGGAEDYLRPLVNGVAYALLTKTGSELGLPQSFYQEFSNKIGWSSEFANQTIDMYASENGFDNFKLSICKELNPDEDIEEHVEKDLYVYWILLKFFMQELAYLLLASPSPYFLKAGHIDADRAYLKSLLESLPKVKEMSDKTVYGKVLGLEALGKIPRWIKD